MATKQCGKCKQVKPIAEFHRHRRDGYQSNCKVCHREECKIYNRTPKRIEYNKRLYEKLKADGYFKEYQQRPQVKMHKAEQQRQYAQDPRLRIRYLARWYAKRMIRTGIVSKEPCAICGKEQAQAHHPDYAQSLLLVWLCPMCHQKIHNEAKAEEK